MSSNKPGKNEKTNQGQQNGSVPNPLSRPSESSDTGSGINPIHAVLGATALAGIALAGRGAVKGLWKAFTTSAEDRELERLESENKKLKSAAEAQQLVEQKQKQKEMELQRAKLENERLKHDQVVQEKTRSDAQIAKQNQIDDEKNRVEIEKKRAEQLIFNKKLVDLVNPIDFTSREGYVSLAEIGGKVKPLLNSPNATALQSRTKFEALMNALQDIGTNVAAGTKIDPEFVSDKILAVKIPSMKNETVLQIIDNIVETTKANTPAADYRYNLEILVLEALKLGMETRRPSTEPMLSASVNAKLAP